MRQSNGEILSSAIRRARRVRRATGRIAVSALGFGLAYYFDTENGGARREQLRRSLRRTAATIDSVLASEVGDPPVFYPLLRGLKGEGPEPSVVPPYVQRSQAS